MYSLRLIKNKNKSIQHLNLIICWGHTFEHFGVKKMFCFNVLKKLFIVFNNE